MKFTADPSWVAGALAACRERLRQFARKVVPDPIERVIKIYPARGKTRTDPGIMACRLFMVLVRDGKAVSVSFSTDWFLKPHHDEIKDGYGFHLRCYGSAYHSPTPQFDGQEVNEWCQWLAGPCYCAHDSGDSDEYEQLMLTGGTEAVWARLEAYWGEMFLEWV